MAVLVKPEGVGVATDEFLCGESLDQGWSPDAFLFSIDKDDLEFCLALLPGFALGGREALLSFLGHGLLANGRLMIGERRSWPLQSGSRGLTQGGERNQAAKAMHVPMRQKRRPDTQWKMKHAIAGKPSTSVSRKRPR